MCIRDRYYGVGGPQPVSFANYLPPITFDLLRAGVDLGYNIIDLNGAKHVGFGLGQLFANNGVRVSPAEAFLKPAIHRRNLHIALNTTVTKINLEGKKAVSVDVITCLLYTSRCV